MANNDNLMEIRTVLIGNGALRKKFENRPGLKTLSDLPNDIQNRLLVKLTKDATILASAALQSTVPVRSGHLRGTFISNNANKITARGLPKNGDRITLTGYVFIEPGPHRPPYAPNRDFSAQFIASQLEKEPYKRSRISWPQPGFHPAHSIFTQGWIEEGNAQYDIVIHKYLGTNQTINQFFTANIEKEYETELREENPEYNVINPGAKLNALKAARSKFVKKTTGATAGALFGKKQTPYGKPPAGFTPIKLGLSVKAGATRFEY